MMFDILFIALNEVYGPTLCCLYSGILHQSGIGMYYRLTYCCKIILAQILQPFMGNGDVYI